MATQFDSWSSPQHFPHNSNGNQSSQKKPRHRHAPHQLAALNELFEQNEHPPLEQRTALAERLGMETKTVNAWFQNKRASSKKRIRNAPSTDTLATNSQVISHPQPTYPRHSDHDDHQEDEFSVDHHHSRSASVALSDGQPPFFSGSLDQPHFIAESDGIARKMRLRPSNEQIDELRKVYSINPHPTTEQRQALAATIGMRYQSITNWFQNQRSLARKRKEDDLDDFASTTPKPEYYPHEHRQFSAFPPPTHLHPSLPLPAPSYPQSPPRSPSISPSMDEQPSRRSSSHHRTAPYGSPSTFSRPRRSRPEPYQLEALKELFTKTSTPTIEERSALALEIGMDVGKVTNWFRNLRQTARKRAKKSDSDDDDDGRDPFSASASRSGTPSLPSSSSSVNNDPMDMDVGDYDIHLGQSDPGSEEDYQEAVTPPPERSPEPPAPHPRYETSRIDTFDNLAYRSELDKVSTHQFSGIRIEDALLLLSFHQHIVRC